MSKKLTRLQKVVLYICEHGDSLHAMDTRKELAETVGITWYPPGEEPEPEIDEDDEYEDEDEE